jgi:hypothetical protein
MLIQILRNAPVWVWPLLAALIALGLSQRRDRSIPLPRATIVPVMMVGLSLLGTASASGVQSAALLAWAAGLAVGTMVADAAHLWRGITWLALERRLQVPGSWAPLVLILSIFATKFVVGALVSVQPGVTAVPGFGVAVGLAYGVLSGLFLARGIAMWKAVRATPPLAV